MASQLTPAVRLQTNAPFPNFRKDEGTGKPTLCLDPNEKILIESCAEFMHFDVPGSTYGTSADFILLHDLEGQPMILSIGTDKHLYLCAYVNGGSGSWQTFDISPGPNFEASVCDASKSPDNKNILIAVSGHENADKIKTKLYQLVFNCPKLVADEKGMIQGSPFENVPWLETGKSISTREVKTLVCEYFGGESQYQIVAGVGATTLEGSHYIYSPSQDKDWIHVKFPQQVQTIRSCVPANLPSLGPGYVVLFEDNSAEKAVSCFYQGDGVSKQVYLTGLQNSRKLFASVNKRGFTDILIAAENGIGFVDNMTEDPRLLLHGIPCSHVLGSEYAVSKDESTLVIYAVSAHGELFVVKGSRKASNGNSVEFSPSSVPIPIRNGVRNIAGKINPLTGAFETVYVSMDSDTLKHLTRDPVTSLWKEAEMIVRSKAPNKKVRTPAFLVTITLSNGKGAPVPTGYRLQLTSSPALVYINDRSYNLTRRPQTVSVNGFGQLQIVVPAADSLAAAPIGIKFMPDTEETKTFNIQPAQRVLYTLSNLKSGDALKNARTSDNQPFFSDAIKQKHGDKFDQAADVLSKVPLMVASTESGEVNTAAEGAKEITVAWQKDESGISSSATEWLSDAADAIGEVLGDAIEYLKTAVKGVVKIALKIAGPVVRLILKIGAKVIRFVLNSVSSIVTSLTCFLEGLFGIDLSSIRDWFTFRYKKVEATQKELASIIDNGLLLTSRYLHYNHDVVSNSIDTFGRFIEGYITRPYPAQQMSKNESSGSTILNNPIIANLLKFNPLGWIMEAIAEEVGEDVKIPSLDLNIGGQIFATLKEQFNLLLSFLKRSWAGFEAAIGEPESVMKHLYDIFRDGFWTIFDSLKAIILAIYSLVMNSFDRITEFCRSKWQIPYITDLWEDMTNTDFTLINFVSYVAAQLLELANPKSTPVLEGMGLSSVLGNLDEKKMPSILPKSLADDLEASKGSAGGSFEEQIRSTKIAQKEGAIFMAANPVTQPRFGLMANTATLPEKPDEPSMQPPSTAVRYILAFARSGKTLSRSANVAIEGCLQGGIGGDSQNPGNGGPKGGEVEMTSLPSSVTKPDAKLSILDESFDLSNTSTAGSLTSIPEDTVTPQKGLGLQVGGVKSLLIGSNAFGFGCRAVEQFILLNYYDQVGRNAENFDGNCVEMIASLVGLILSCFADAPPILALSNMIVSAGCFAGSCMAPEKGFFRISEMVGSGCSTLSSVLFLVKEPTCQTIAWVGVGIDAVNTVLTVGYQCCWPWVQQLPVVGPRPNPDRPDPKRDDDPLPDIGDKSPPRKKKKLVTRAQAMAAQELRTLLINVVAANDPERLQINFGRAEVKYQSEIPLLCIKLEKGIRGIFEGNDWYVANTQYRSVNTDFRNSFIQVGISDMVASWYISDGHEADRECLHWEEIGQAILEKEDRLSQHMRDSENL